MMKPLLLVSAIALAAPVLAQSTTNTGTTGTTTTTGSMSQGTTGTSSGTTANGDAGAAGGNMTNTQNTTQNPADDDDANDHGAMGHGTTGTSTGTTATGTMTGTSSTGTTGTMSGTGTNQSTMGTSGAAGQTTAANWNNSSGGMTVQPGNTNPERDARGIAVVSAPAVAPAGWNGSGGTAMGGPLVEAGAGEAGGQNYPACSRTVTDNCLQTYERGRSR